MIMNSIRQLRSTRFAVLLMLATLGLAVAACGATEEPTPEPEPVDEAAPEPMPLDNSILGDETRPEDEVAEDEFRKALEVHEFFGIQAGQTVADIWPGGGYNTHLLSRLTGDSGKVYGVMGFYSEGQFATLEPLTERIESAMLNNVELSMNLEDVPDGVVDVAISVRNYHDAADLGGGREAAVAQMLRMLKPGGIVGIVDVATDREGWDTDTHRLNESVVVEEFTAGGFELVGRSDLLANPDDDHSTNGFETGRHKADRYVLKFQKPTM